MNWDKIDEILQIDELTAEELSVISAQKAQLRLQENVNLLGQINNLLLEASNELGKWRIIVEKLKHAEKF
ncbi:MAG: hypothetical protein ACTSQ8_26945 [Candidatus Helarchaeota archaeon]